MHGKCPTGKKTTGKNVHVNPSCINDMGKKAKEKN